MMVIGMHNSSEVLSYANYLCKYLEPNSLLSVSDEFRNKYISFARKESSTTFGAETYYGQDFIYKTSIGKIKVFSIPYPFIVICLIMPLSLLCWQKSIVW